MLRTFIYPQPLRCIIIYSPFNDNFILFFPKLLPPIPGAIFSAAPYRVIVQYKIVACLRFCHLGDNFEFENCVIHTV